MEKKQESKNPFLDHLKKYLNTEVIVTQDTSEGKVETIGVCEAIDFHHKNVILKTETSTRWIQRFRYIDRARRGKGGVRGGLRSRETGE